MGPYSYQADELARARRESEHYTPEQRRQALNRLLKLLDEMSPEELEDDPLNGRPTNVSILKMAEDERRSGTA